MPLYNYACNKCGDTKRRLCTPTESLEEMACPCSGEFERAPIAPTTQTKEVLDNGMMARKVERFVEAERMSEERSKIDPTAEKGTKV